MAMVHDVQVVFTSISASLTGDNFVFSHLSIPFAGQRAAQCRRIFFPRHLVCIDTTRTRCRTCGFWGISFNTRHVLLTITYVSSFQIKLSECLWDKLIRITHSPKTIGYAFLDGVFFFEPRGPRRYGIGRLAFRVLSAVVATARPPNVRKKDRRSRAFMRRTAHRLAIVGNGNQTSLQQ